MSQCNLENWIHHSKSDVLVDRKTWYVEICSWNSREAHLQCNLKILEGLHKCFFKVFEDTIKYFYDKHFSGAKVLGDWFGLYEVFWRIQTKLEAVTQQLSNKMDGGDARKNCLNKHNIQLKAYKMDGKPAIANTSCTENTSEHISRRLIPFLYIYNQLQMSPLLKSEKKLITSEKLVILSCRYF